MFGKGNATDRSSGTPENIKAMSAHRGLAIFYVALAFLFAALLLSEAKSASTFVVPLIPLVIGVLHAAIAFGARRRASWARAGSIAIACLMLLAVPIGTLIGVYLLLNSKWPAKASV